MRPEESFIRQPVRSLQTMLRILAENDDSLPSVIPDGIYGPDTMEAVTAFQRQQGLPVTGVANQETWERIVQEYEIAEVNIAAAQPVEILIEPGQVFRLGDSSPYIYLLQAMLIQLSNDHSLIESPGISGVLDEQTALSIRGFQRLSGLAETGEFDRMTWKHLALHYPLASNLQDTL